MIAGHFGLAAGVKAHRPAVPLWALMLATQWLDVVFVPLFLTHVERIDVIGGGPAGYGNGIIHADYTHSLVGAVVLSLIFALPAAWRWGRRAATVLGAVVFSHWLLDLLV
ncbi:MAG TPA: permease, partial [Polyangia bacterium]|nr:permease [Polyangia bacterium]